MIIEEKMAPLKKKSTEESFWLNYLSVKNELSKGSFIIPHSTKEIIELKCSFHIERHALEFPHRVDSFYSMSLPRRFVGDPASLARDNI